MAGQPGVYGDAGERAVIVCSGNIVLDLIARPVDDITWGASIWIDPIERSLGGNGANTAYTLGKLGLPVRLLGLVGSDEPGEFALAQLRRAGVDTSLVGRSSASTASSVVLVKSNGERMFLHHPGASREAFPEPIDVPPSATHYHLASPFALPLQRPHLAESLRRARANGIFTSLDAQWDSQGRWLEDLSPALPHLDLLFLNQDEARMLTGTEDPARAAAAMRGAGAAKVVVKLGRDGCAVYGEGLEVRAPGFEVRVVDTTGAGDCFAGGYLAALARGRSYAEAARFANAVAAMSVRQPGAVRGLGSWEETERFQSAI